MDEDMYHYFKDSVEPNKKGKMKAICKTKVIHRKYLDYVRQNGEKILPTCNLCDIIASEDFPTFQGISHRLMNQRDWKIALKYLEEDNKTIRRRNRRKNDE